MHRALNTHRLTAQREKITQRRKDTHRNAELGGEEERRREEIRNRIAGRAFESVIEFACASGARRNECELFWREWQWQLGWH